MENITIKRLKENKLRLVKLLKDILFLLIDSANRNEEAEIKRYSKTSKKIAGMLSSLCIMEEKLYPNRDKSIKYELKLINDIINAIKDEEYKKLSDLYQEL